MAGEIEILELQPKFLLEEGYERNGKKYRDVYYISDFRIRDTKTLEISIIDVKGSFRLPEHYKLKRNKFLKKYMWLPFKEVYIQKEKIVKEIEY